MSIQTGLIGEYITAAALVQLNCGVAMAQQESIDLVAWFDSGDFMRVQVKSARIYKQKEHSAGYQFQLCSGSKKKTRIDPNKVDVLACVAIDQRKVWFSAACCVNQTTQRRSPAFFERPDIEADSWDKAVSIVMETRR